MATLPVTISLRRSAPDRYVDPFLVSTPARMLEIGQGLPTKAAPSSEE
jgi:hypothetical protein